MFNYSLFKRFSRFLVGISEKIFIYFRFSIALNENNWTFVCCLNECCDRNYFISSLRIYNDNICIVQRTNYWIWYTNTKWNVRMRFVVHQNVFSYSMIQRSRVRKEIEKNLWSINDYVLTCAISSTNIDSCCHFFYSIINFLFDSIEKRISCNYCFCLIQKINGATQSSKSSEFLFEMPAQANYQ